MTLLAPLAPNAGATGLGVVALGLLVGLVVQREIMRAYDGPHAGRWVRVLNIAILPLLWLFGVIVLLRLLDLLRQ